MNSRTNSAQVAAPALRPDKIRVHKVLTNFFPGGTERQVLNLVKGMDHQVFDVEFSCLQRKGDFLKAFEAFELPIREFRIKRLYGPRTFQQQVRFAAHLRKQQTQILHSYNFYANVFAVPAARLAGVPLVLASVRDRGVYLSPAQKKLQRWVLSLADHILVNADSIRYWLLDQGLRGDRISVIKNGIDLSCYQPVQAPSGTRRNLGIDEAAPIVILVARLDPSKGIDDFIKAAALVAPKHPDACFLIVGAGLKSKEGDSSEDTSYRDELMSLADSLGIANQVVFAGHRKDTPSLFAQAAVSVLPSLSEGLSNTLLESMAAGVPAVATNVGGNPELIKNGVNGLLVPVRSPEHLAGAIGELLENPEHREALGAEARRIAWQDYSLNGMVGRTEHFYREQFRPARRAPASGMGASAQGRSS